MCHDGQSKNTTIALLEHSGNVLARGDEEADNEDALRIPRDRLSYELRVISRSLLDSTLDSTRRSTRHPNSVLASGLPSRLVAMAANSSLPPWHSSVFPLVPIGDGITVSESTAHALSYACYGARHRRTSAPTFNIHPNYIGEHLIRRAMFHVLTDTIDDIVSFLLPALDSS